MFVVWIADLPFAPFVKGSCEQHFHAGLLAELLGRLAHLAEVLRRVVGNRMRLLAAPGPVVVGRAERRPERGTPPPLRIPIEFAPVFGPCLDEMRIVADAIRLRRFARRPIAAVVISADRNCVLSIADIAENCGFPNTSHFGVMFKRHFNRTPSSLRKY